ncbi:MAG: Fe-S cluster assembly ATPase SufC [Candidatus Marinarcus sp.]|uniref:Fe-S cluster assembly ATPase SufC n=1 Tax=Candidatus Marinarcus sp. TaxID=3100987 RepID=UPI003B00D036
MLEIKNLSVNIKDKTILQDLNLTIKDGEVHVLMGLNGTGKSTLVKAISGHFDCEVTQGSIQYNKKELLKLDASQRANEGIFMSFQNPVEIPGVNNNYFLKSALNEKRQYQKQTPLNAAEFIKYIKEITSKYNIDNAILKRDVNDGFSGGEKKRNEILQLLTLKPDFIMLDEIDSGLDIDALKIVANSVNSLLDGKRSLLMITHYERLLDFIKPDFVHILSGGKIIKTGDYSLALEIEKNGYEAFGVSHDS